MDVRLALELTGNPPTREEPTFAVPMARNSWLLCTRVRLRVAKARAVRMLSVYPTTKMPSAGSSRMPRSVVSSEGRPTFMPSKDTSPTVVTPCAVRSNTATTAVASSMTTSGTGTFG